MSDFRKALLWTASPILIITVISIALVVAADGNVPLPAGQLAIGLWFLAAFYTLIALITGIIFLLRGRKAKAGGIIAGVAIGIISLSGSCIINLRIVNILRF